MISPKMISSWPKTTEVYAKKVLEAETRVRPYVRETYLESSRYLSNLGHARVHLKMEHLQHTGSFKLRGAINKILSLSSDELKQGIITASNGNHGMAVCFAAKQVGTSPTVYMKKGVSAERIQLIHDLGGRTKLFGVNPVEAEIKARAVASRRDQVFISPYNDKEVIAGQGTIGVELHRQLEDIDAVFVAVGGGGLVSGIASYLKAKLPQVRIIGCWPENSRVLFESIRAGRVIDFPETPTISESTAGGIENGSITLDLCRNLIDDYVLVSEAEILHAMKLIMSEERTIVEGAAGVAVAAYIKEQQKYRGESVVILLCGRNTNIETLRKTL
ncbi:MAG TPA: threonine/serine dehydratase [Pyrinomonadaceae bacterium]|jgi:threonine dehydratase